jgi:hypothetical protein
MSAAGPLEAAVGTLADLLVIAAVYLMVTKPGP